MHPSGSARLTRVFARPKLIDRVATGKGHNREEGGGVGGYQESLGWLAEAFRSILPLPSPYYGVFFFLMSTLLPITPPRIPPAAAPMTPPLTLLRLVVAPRMAPAAAPMAASRFVFF